MRLMLRTINGLLLVLLCGLQAAIAQQLVTVNPGEIRVDGDKGVRQTVTWRIASRGGASSAQAEFVNLDNNRVLEAMAAPLGTSDSVGTVSEQLRISPAQARRWYSAGVRRLGYRRTFSGAGGSISNRVVIQLQFSGRLAGLSASPAQQTLTENSGQMMLKWDFRGAGLGELNAVSTNGYFLDGDRVVYTVEQRLVTDGQRRITEVVQLPPGLVKGLLAEGVEQLRYSRTFIDSKDRQRSASVIVNLRR
ncbi:hypothetical protein [Microbulbifer marinus]|uniref:Uncharacterized protein n=1 Tax=Microbulbifer marinus TaxID=658218 RepID=A0A1H3YMD0_9GAMM|nr:hypothetical protein [Microbulbifer marinus]SEA12769.1 hypothetical protein SAMN05216562_1865 [Microbulbifer marinus]